MLQWDFVFMLFFRYTVIESTVSLVLAEVSKELIVGIDLWTDKGELVCDIPVPPSSNHMC